MTQFLPYGAGMGPVNIVLTAGIALLKEGLVVAKLRAVIPYMQPATGRKRPLTGHPLNGLIPHDCYLPEVRGVSGRLPSPDGFPYRLFPFATSRSRGPPFGWRRSLHLTGKESQDASKGIA